MHQVPFRYHNRGAQLNSWLTVMAVHRYPRFQTASLYTSSAVRTGLPSSPLPASLPRSKPPIHLTQLLQKKNKIETKKTYKFKLSVKRERLTC